MSLQIEGGTAADQARVQRVVKEAIQRASRQITDGKLRSCVIDKLVHDGTIQIDRDCRRNLLGSNFWLFSFAKIWASDTIHVCLNNISEDDDDCLIAVILHEFAHSCCWDHGDNEGVPGDKGTLPCP